MADEIETSIITPDERAAQADIQQQREPEVERPRDESGKFAPKTEPKGIPDQQARARREAQERDEFKSKYETEAAERARLEKRFSEMEAFLKGAEPEAKPEPLSQIKETVDKLATRFDQQDQQAQEAQMWQQVNAYANADEQKFTAEKPDFPTAVQHYISSRMQELKAFGLDDAGAEQHLTQEAQSLLMDCAKAGTSPSQTLYIMAQARGYQPGNQTPRVQPQGTRSLGAVNGVSPAVGNNIQALRNMGEDEWMIFKRDPANAAMVRAALGG